MAKTKITQTNSQLQWSHRMLSGEFGKLCRDPVQDWAELASISSICLDVVEDQDAVRETTCHHLCHCISGLFARQRSQ